MSENLNTKETDDNKANLYYRYNMVIGVLSGIILLAIIIYACVYASEWIHWDGLKEAIEFGCIPAAVFTANAILRFVRASRVKKDENYINRKNVGKMKLSDSIAGTVVLALIMIAVMTFCFQICTRLRIEKVSEASQEADNYFQTVKRIYDDQEVMENIEISNDAMAKLSEGADIIEIDWGDDPFFEAVVGEYGGEEAVESLKRKVDNGHGHFFIRICRDEKSKKKERYYFEMKYYTEFRHKEPREYEGEWQN